MCIRDRDYALQEYYNKNEELPETLNNLKDSIRYFSLNFVNPVNNEEYVYEIVGEKKYRLCTYFSSSNILKAVSYTHLDVYKRQILLLAISLF